MWRESALEFSSDICSWFSNPKLLASTDEGIGTLCNQGPLGPPLPSSPTAPAVPWRSPSQLLQDVWRPKWPFLQVVLEDGTSALQLQGQAGIWLVNMCEKRVATNYKNTLRSQGDRKLVSSNSGQGGHVWGLGPGTAGLGFSGTRGRGGTAGDRGSSSWRGLQKPQWAGATALQMLPATTLTQYPPR